MRVVFLSTQVCGQKKLVIPVILSREAYSSRQHLARRLVCLQSQMNILFRNDYAESPHPPSAYARK